jgi:hypothetical protein
VRDSKYLLLICFAVVLTACGGGGTEVSSESSGVSYPSANRSYPYSDRIIFQRQRTGDVLSLSDRSLWYLTGDYSAGYDALGAHDIDIYEDSGQFGEPTAGATGTHYMYINGSTRAFYLECIPNLEVVTSDILPFHRESLGTLIALSNGLLWQVVGVHSSGYDVLGAHAVNIYTNLEEMPNIATTGRSSAYYLHVESSSRGFYVEPLTDLTIQTVNAAYFNRQSVGDFIQLDDGTLLRIVGEHKFGYDVLDKHDVLIYTNVGEIPNPTSGERSDEYLYIYGSSAGFFVERL